MGTTAPRLRIALGMAFLGILLPAATGVQADEPEFIVEAKPPVEALCLSYRRPARGWLEALPLGNGRVGAMV